jgi:RNA recognition motif-containing protein
MNIFVASLPFTLGEADLRESFEAYGLVDSVKIIMDKTTGRSKGFGFVEMPNAEEAQNAIQGLNGATVGGRPIVVNETDTRAQQPQRKSFGGGGGRPSFNSNGGGQRSFNRDSNGGGGYRGNNDRYGNSGGGGGYRSNDRYNSNDGGGYRGNNDRYGNSNGGRSNGGYRRDYNNDSDE